MNTPARMLLILALAAAAGAAAPDPAVPSLPVAAEPAARTRISLDRAWRFALGDPCDPRKDYGHGLAYFSYFAKAGYGDGPAASGFDDRAWRLLDLPHDWAVEAPFSPAAGYSHGYKAIGRGFPAASIGWYRKTFSVPASALGRRISVEFEGVFRDSVVWINGFYLGREQSGYTGFGYDLTDYLNYGGDNVIAVRVDASQEEGWFYEGAGIYRHVWLVDTAPLHVAADGTFVTCAVAGNSADVTARTTVANDGPAAAEFAVEQTIVDAAGQIVARGELDPVSLPPGETREFPCLLRVDQPQLWSVESPVLYRLVTSLRSGSAIIDRCETTFGIRTIRFDPDQGFFLNGRRVELLGTNNHQDCAGVGVAVPDALEAYRIGRLKALGANAWRCAHNPPAPALLDACDRLGVLVIDEARQMGTGPEQRGQLERLIRRDRNHPSVILWSVGNEEWAIEGNVKGARLTASVEAVARRLDPSRRTTVAISGGWGGSSTTTDVVGYNYIHQSNSDDQHARFPVQPGVGTEESTTRQTRGVYADDSARGHLGPLMDAPSGGNMETGWKHYAARPYLAGVFFWTGFDHRGEPNPFGWPQVGSQCGVLDLCGFPKDCAYYLQSWWIDRPVVHVFPHWNWPGREGQPINVWCYSNCDEVELLLNGRSLGRKPMERNGHLEWTVPYAPGTLLARGFQQGRETATDRVETTGAPAALRLDADRTVIRADGADVAVVAVPVLDAQGRVVPTAGNAISFSLQGPGRIIGVGNGDPASHEPDRFVGSVTALEAAGWRRHEVDASGNRPEVAPEFDDSAWPVEREPSDGAAAPAKPGANTVWRGVFECPAPSASQDLTLLVRPFGAPPAVFLNGRELPSDPAPTALGTSVRLEPGLLRAGRNVVAIVAPDSAPRTGAAPAVIRVATPPAPWQRSAFNGLAQVIVQASTQPGELTLVADSPGLAPATLRVTAR